MKHYGHILGWVWRATVGYRGSIALCMVLDMARVALGWVFVLASKRAIDIATGDAGGTLWHVLVALPAVQVAEYALSSLSTWIAGLRNVELDNRLKQSLVRHLLDSEWRGIERYHTGDVVSRVEGDVATVVGCATDTLPGIVNLLIQFFGSFFILWSLDRVLATVLLFVLPFFAFFARLYARRMHSITLDVRRAESQVQSQVQESLQHRTVIKTLEQTDSTLARLGATMRGLVGHVRRRLRLAIATHLLVSGGFSIGYFLTFMWGVLQIARGAITYGTMTAFIQLAGRVQRPIADLSRTLPTLVRAFAAAERLMDLEALPLEPVGDHVPLVSPVGLRLRGVSFAYPMSGGASNDTSGAKRRVFDTFSFDFEPSTATAILGETGVGKTTLVRMLLALITPDDGSVEAYDTRGTLIAPVDATVRRYVAYVPQGNTLLSGTIRSNLQLGRMDATEADMNEALRAAAADFVAQLPDGLDTPCGEAGGGLSEGQAQRIAIARALLRRVPILLLDESTSALDPATEQRVLDNIMSRARDERRTVIIVTHRDAAAQRCDRTLRL